jgi:hypothetical protein
MDSGSPNHSHSILSMHRNALIYKSKIFLLTVKARPSRRQNFSLMISKENSRDSNSAAFQRLSTTIGRFFTPSTMGCATRRYKERPSAIRSTTRSHSLCSLLTVTLGTTPSTKCNGACFRSARISPDVHVTSMVSGQPPSLVETTCARALHIV